MKRKIVFHGMLKSLVPNTIELAVSSVKEAIEALCVITGKALHPQPGRGHLRVSVVGFDNQADLFRPLRDDEEELHLMPAFGGAGGGGAFQIILGVVLVAAAVMLGPVGGMAAGTWAAMSGTTALALGVMGAMMVLGGIMSMMSPAPSSATVNSVSNPEGSLYLGAPQNTTKAGTPIPIGYGKFRCYGQVLSADIEATAVSL